MDESVRLMTLQQTLEKESDGKVAFFGLSVNETIRTCLVNGMSKRADKVKSDFKVPDKRSVSCFAHNLLSWRLLTRPTPHVQILVCQAPSADVDPRLRGPGGVREIKAEPDRVRGICEAPRRQGPREGGPRVRAALRRPEAHGPVRALQ